MITIRPRITSRRAYIPWARVHSSIRDTQFQLTVTRLYENVDFDVAFIAPMTVDILALSTLFPMQTHAYDTA